MPTAPVFICTAWRGDPSKFYQPATSTEGVLAQGATFVTESSSLLLFLAGGWLWHFIANETGDESTRGHIVPGAHHENIWRGQAVIIRNWRIRQTSFHTGISTLNFLRLGGTRGIPDPEDAQHLQRSLRIHCFVPRTASSEIYLCGFT